jgi:hypothetical protein
VQDRGKKTWHWVVLSEASCGSLSAVLLPEIRSSMYCVREQSNVKNIKEWLFPGTEDEEHIFPWVPLYIDGL